MSADDQLMEEIAKFYDDPLGYVMFVFPWSTEPAIQMVKLEEPYRSRFNCEYGPDKWACEFLDELGEDIRARNFDGATAVEPIRYSTSSGHGIGKSTLVAWLIKFILDTRPFSKGVVTANTSDQLRTKTWAELGKWHKMSLTAHLYDYSSGRGAMSISRKSDKEHWRADAQTCREENSEAFQGLHAANSTPFYIFDEASGIPDKIWASRAGGATDGEPMSFDFGNPTRNSGQFFENCIGTQKHRYKVQQIDSRDVTITNKNLIQEWLEDHGEDSDFFKVKVRGVFPSAGAIQFISNESVDNAMMRETTEDKNAPLLIGVDVARFGDDETVIYPRIGYDARSWRVKRFKGLDTVQVAGKVIETIREFKELGKDCSGLFIDGGGLGGGVVDQLRHFGYSPTEVNFGEKPTDYNSYRFKVDEMWADMRAAMPKLCLPRDPDLRAQLTQREYGYTVVGHKMNLESKKDMKKRGVQSPDLADALCLTFAIATPLDIHVVPTWADTRETKHDYDPLGATW
jgi:hypothetical protein